MKIKFNNLSPINSQDLGSNFKMFTPHKQESKDYYEREHKGKTDTLPRVLMPIIEPKRDPNKKIRATAWYGDSDIRLIEVNKPMITEDRDVIVKITSASICGSDLHLYHHEFAGMKRGDILGHEFMGIIEDVGSKVSKLKIGDKVVVSAIIACGECEYCRARKFSNCDNTNPSKQMEDLYGHRTAGIFGYSALTGGYDGGQAEYVRVPIADINCLKVPNDIPDEKLLFLSDAGCTGYHATRLAKVKEGLTVAIWGAGPVGLMAAMWSKFEKAKRVIVIDAIPHLLKKAESFGCETLNFSEVNIVKKMKEICPGGPDCVIDAVGFRFPKSFLHRFERAMFLETDSPQVLNECITCVKKGGRIGVVGDYLGYTNHFLIGALMEKGLTLASGQVHVQKYWNDILRIIQEGKVDLSFIISHRYPLREIREAYRLFDTKEDDCIKIIIDTQEQYTK